MEGERVTEERTKKAIIAGLEERLAAIAAIAARYDEYMGDPDGEGGDHWGECPLDGGVSPVDTPELYDRECSDDCDGVNHDDCTWAWNPEKGAAACVCSVGDFWRIARIARGEK